MKKKLLKILLNPSYAKAIFTQYKQLKFYKNRNVIIGLYCNITGSKLANESAIFEETNFINSTIGEHSYIGKHCNIRFANIGKFCSIASDVTIGLGIHPINFISTHPAFYSNNKVFKTFSDKMYITEFKKTIIGNDVWIGSHVIIPGGINIGDGAIIATGAIVTKDVAPYSIVGGVPAKLIKYRFNPQIIEKIKKIKWWNFDDEWLINNFHLFHNSDKFLKYFENSR